MSWVVTYNVRLFALAMGNTFVCGSLTLSSLPSSSAAVSLRRPGGNAHVQSSRALERHFTSGARLEPQAPGSTSLQVRPTRYIMVEWRSVRAGLRLYTYDVPPWG